MRIASREVGRLGFGCFSLTGGYGAADATESIATIHAALANGVTVLDTSDAYAMGDNERLVGRALEGRRQAALITTKFGWRLDADGQPVGLDGSPAYVRQSCEASLRRLRTDWIDLYLQHRVDPSTPVEDTVGELDHLCQEGKIRAFGLSEAGASTVERAHAVSPLAAVQTEYSIWSREPEERILPLCQELGLVFMAYSPLGRGFLSGLVKTAASLRADDFRRTHPRFQADNIRHNLALVRRLTELAQRLNCTPAQLALAWLLHQPFAVLPIFGSRHVHHLLENLASIEVHLESADLESIDGAIKAAPIRGTRHPEAHMPTLGR